MARTKGSTNLTPRELKAKAKALQEKAKLKERLEKLKKKS